VPLGDDCLKDSPLCPVQGAPNIVCLNKPERTKRGMAGKSGCLGFSPNSTTVCTAHNQCCSGVCFITDYGKNTCMPSGLDLICPMDDTRSPCMPGLICTLNSTLNTILYGFCKRDSASN